MSKTTNIGFIEYIDEKVQDLVKTMPWMGDTDMKLCENIAQLQAFVDLAIARGSEGKKPHCCLDLETTGLNTRMIKGQPANKIVGIALAISKDQGIYIPVNHKEGSEFNLKENLVLTEIQRLCKCCIIIVHNAKFDLSVLKNFGIIINNYEDFEDTLIMARLYDAGQKSIGLKELSKSLLNRPMIELKEITNGSQRLDLVSPTTAYIYAASDSLCTYALYDLFSTHQIIIDQKSIYNLEKRLVFVVMQMESNLVYIDKEYLLTEKARITERVRYIESEVHRIADDKDFNVGSTQQLGKILFEKLGYEYPSKTKTASGQYMTDTATLEKIADKYPMVKLIIEFRELEKSLGTYIENLLSNCDEDSCIKLSFNQNGTDTGRFSSPGGHGRDIDGYSGVNVQSIPANYSASAPDIRRAFRARPGKKLVAMDFSGEELRVATNLSKEPKWINEFLHGSADLHTTTGKAIFKKEEISKAERQIAKCVAKGTFVASDRGWIPVEKLTINDKVLTHTGNLKKIEKVWDMGIKPGIQIITRSGHKITCGVNHRFLTLNNDWVRAEDLKPGQIIKSASCEKLEPEKIQKVHFNFWDKGNNKFISEDLPYVEINPLWSRLMGYIMGDGSICINSARIVCSDEFEDVKEDILTIATKLGLYPKVIKTHRLKKDGTYGRWLYNISIGSRILVRFFREMGFSGRREWKEEEKFPGRHKSCKIFRIPQIIFSSPKFVAKEFLSGLFETDGTISGKSQTSVTTKDREFAEDIILLLASFGIKAYIVEHESKRYNRMYYKVCLGVHASKVFQKEIGFISENKKRRLYELTQRGIAHPRPGDFSMKWETEIKHVIPVENVSLMDLTVEEDHTYVAQGLITHNTCNFQILYGSGPRGISEQAKISEMEARRAVDGFFAGLPTLASWIKRERVIARKSKSAKSVFGRVRPLQMFYDSGDKGLEAKADRCAVNFSIQGACADIMKVVMVRIASWISENNLQDEIKILITMHDELVFEMPEDKLDLYVPQLNNIMSLSDILQGIFKWPVPLTVDAEYGDTWHVDHDLFKEKPHLKTAATPIEFHQPTQVLETPAPVQSIPESIQPATVPTEPVSSEPISNPVETEPVSGVKNPEEDKKTELLEPEVITYKIKNLTDTTLLKINTILTMLTKECENKIYEGPIKTLKIYDRENTVLSVSNMKVRSDSFFILARLFGL
jgi:DNA polymerase I-like protein with 3'-5' exonuclease and polymerase domains/intein/homing endonuclease